MLLYHMRVKIFNKNLFIFFLTIMSVFVNNTFAQNSLNISFNETEKWEFISDNVMGGVSTGTVEFLSINGNLNALIKGQVSTENNGGFIQIRYELNDTNLIETSKIRVVAKGNNQKYFIFLRTKGTILPWQYYSHEFDVRSEYDEFILQIKDFKKSGMLLSNQIDPKKITSIGIVAYGRDHLAELYVKELEFLE